MKKSKQNPPLALLGAATTENFLSLWQETKGMFGKQSIDEFLIIQTLSNFGPPVLRSVAREQAQVGAQTDDKSALTRQLRT